MTPSNPYAAFSAKPKRLFIASWPDPLVLEMIADFQSALQKAARFTPVSAKWIPVEMLHLTFHFLGDCDHKTEAKVRQLLQNLEGNGQFTAMIQSLGYFPHSKAPTVLWLGVQNREKRLHQLHTLLNQGLQSLEIELPEHDFTPHLTLARFSSLRGTGVFTSVLQSYQAKFVANWNVRSIDLVESCLSPEGPSYKRLLTVPLYS